MEAAEDKEEVGICFCGTDRHELDNAYSFEGAWVQCDECERWCHGECAGLSLEEAEAIESYVCPVCRPGGVAGVVARVQAAARKRRQARASRAAATLTLLCPTEGELARARARQEQLEDARVGGELDGSGRQEEEEDGSEARARSMLWACGGDVAAACNAGWSARGASVEARSRPTGGRRDPAAAVEEDRRGGREEGATGRMQCENGHDLVWVRRDGAGLRCDGGCGRGIKRGGWWACGGCDYDVCTSCYEEEVGAVGA